MKHYQRLIILLALLLCTAAAQAQYYENLRPLGNYVHARDVLFQQIEIQNDRMCTYAHDFTADPGETGYYQESLSIFSIANQSQLTLLGEKRISTHYYSQVGDPHIKQIALNGDYLLVSVDEIPRENEAATFYTLLYDISIPSQPRIADSLHSISLNSPLLTMRGDTLCFCDLAIHISDVDSIEVHTTAYDHALAFDAMTDTLGIRFENLLGLDPTSTEDDSTELTVYHIVSLDSIEEIGALKFKGRTTRTTFLSPSQLVTTGLSGGSSSGFSTHASLIDVSNPAAPKLTATVPLPSITVPTPSGNSTNLFLAAKELAWVPLDEENAPSPAGWYYPAEGNKVNASAGVGAGVIVGVDNVLIALIPDPAFVTVEEPEMSGLPDRFEIVSAYPNPFNAMLNLKVRASRGGVVTGTLYSVLGQRVLSFSKSFSSNEMGTISLAAPPGLASGVYLLRIANESGETASRRVALLR